MVCIWWLCRALGLYKMLKRKYMARWWTLVGDFIWQFTWKLLSIKEERVPLKLVSVWPCLCAAEQGSENSFRLINLERKAYANALFQLPFYLGHFEVFSLARCGAIFSQDPWFTCLLSTVASLSWSWITVTVEQRVFPFYKSVLKDLP